MFFKGQLKLLKDAETVENTASKLFKNFKILLFQ